MWLRSKFRMLLCSLVGLLAAAPLGAADLPLQLESFRRGPPFRYAAQIRRVERQFQRPAHLRRPSQCVCRQ